MSYLDKPLNRESFDKHISTKSKSHKVNSRIALDWFDKFCIGQFDGKNEKIILSDLMNLKYKNPQKHSQNLFNLLQDFINYLATNGQKMNGCKDSVNGNTLDPATIRANFNLVKNYLNWYGFEIYSESVKSRLNFPKKIEEETYPITIDDIKKILDNSTEQRKVLYLFLSCTGMRIQETLQLRKRDLVLDKFPRVIVKIPGKYTKTKKARKTFISKETENYLLPILKKIKDDDLIFGINEDSLKSKHSEEEVFTRMRERAGLTERYDNGIHKITLHSFRHWFVTKCNRIDSDFGNALAGHTRYMKRYDNQTEEELCQLFIKAEPSLSIFDNTNDIENFEKIKELQAKLDILEKERKENIGIKELVDDLKLRVDLLATSKEEIKK